MAGEEWIRVAEESVLEEGVPVATEVAEDKKVLVVRLKGKVHACGNECSHYGAPLTDGVLSGTVLTCPWHNARFDVTTGRMLAAPALNNLPLYEAKVEGGAVYVRPSGSHLIPMPEGRDERVFLILGAGASGNAAAEMLRREGFAGRIVMVTAEEASPYDRTMLSKAFLSGEAPEKWLPLRGEKFYSRLKIEVLTGRSVAAVDPARRSITFDSGGTLQGDALLLATGGVPRRLEIPGAELPGCFLLRSLGDARAVVEACQEAERAVVLGASFIGLEVASSLRHREIEVHVVAPEEVPLQAAFGPEVGGRVRRRHEDNGVHFHLGRTASRLKGDGRVREVELSDGTVLPADLVVVGVGIRPAVDCLAGSGLVKEGAVPVDGCLQTAAEGVFASGDIAVVPDARAGTPRRVEHWVEAERQGQHAARAMLGSKEPYREVPFFWTRQFGSSLKYIGHAGRWDRVVMREEGESFLAGYYQGETLRAAAGIGMAREFIVLGEMLANGTTLPPAKLADRAFDILGR